MQSLRGNIILITGATAGIGLSCAKQFAAQGANLILTGRRSEKLNHIVQELSQKYSIEILPLVFDVAARHQVNEIFQALPEKWRAIDILINNAGLALAIDKVQNGHVDDWETMIDTNVKGLLYVTRQVLPWMLQRNKGHIVNISSISGYQVYSGATVYCATKFAVRALSQGIKMDVHGTPLRVTEIAPGMVKTEFSEVRFSGDKTRAENIYSNMTPLSADDIADAVLFCTTRPAHVNIQSLFINPTDQSSVNLVHRHEG